MVEGRLLAVVADRRPAMMVAGRGAAADNFGGDDDEKDEAEAEAPWCSNRQLRRRPVGAEGEGAPHRPAGDDDAVSTGGAGAKDAADRRLRVEAEDRVP